MKQAEQTTAAKSDSFGDALALAAAMQEKGYVVHRADEAFGSHDGDIGGRLVFEGAVLIGPEKLVRVVKSFEELGVAMAVDGVRATRAQARAEAMREHQVQTARFVQMLGEWSAKRNGSQLAQAEPAKDAEKANAAASESAAKVQASAASAGEQVSPVDASLKKLAELHSELEDELTRAEKRLKPALAPPAPGSYRFIGGGYGEKLSGLELSLAIRCNTVRRLLSQVRDINDRLTV